MAKKKHTPDPSDLDLHGVYHADVPLLVENHIHSHHTPFRLITGNSYKMKKICKEVLDRCGYKYTDGTLFNPGCIEVIS